MSIVNAQVAATIADLNQLAEPATRLYQSMRGSKALAELVGNVKQVIDRIRSEVPEEVIAEWFVSKDITVGSNSTSKYPAFIAAICGEEHLEGQKFTSPIDGEEYVTWVPDRSMEVYFHTMEELDHLGIRASYKDAILAQGGALKMARNRQERIMAETQPSRERQSEIEVKMLVNEGQRVPLSGVHAPTLKNDKVSEFFTVLCHRVGDEVVSLGVVNKSAGAVARKMAKEQYPELSKKVRGRKKAPEFDLDQIGVILAETAKKRNSNPATKSKRAAA